MAEKAEDLYLPVAVISRIIKDALPEGVSVSKEARVAISRAASVFILYATSTHGPGRFDTALQKCSSAIDFTKQDNRKTLAPKDILEALKEMEFNEFIEPLEQKIGGLRKPKKPSKKGSGRGAESGTGRAKGTASKKPPAKRAKKDSVLQAATVGEESENEVEIIDDEEDTQNKGEDAMETGAESKAEDSLTDEEADQIDEAETDEVTDEERDSPVVLD